ncbi:MAG: DinB family protein [Ignavibacteriae bacterium]|nr:MAG: DinB family protein [Ignavibacteriota bacterium]
MMENTINELKSLLIDVPVRFASIPSNVVSVKPAPDKWSKKEILGHLCDSAVNNLSRFIRAQFENEPMNIIRYEQNEWVKLNGYKDKPVTEIIEFWKCLNNQLVYVASRIPEEKLGFKCDKGDGETLTLQELAEDYIVHMKHHLAQIFND